MSVGPPRWTWRSMSSTACWNSDARTMSASPNLDGAGVNAPAPLIRATQPRAVEIAPAPVHLEICLVHRPAAAHLAAPAPPQSLGQGGGEFGLPLPDRLIA